MVVSASRLQGRWGQYRLSKECQRGRTPRQRLGLLEHLVHPAGGSELTARKPSPLFAEGRPPGTTCNYPLGPQVQEPGLVWFITGIGKFSYVCVVGTAPLQRHPTDYMSRLLCINKSIHRTGSGFA